MRHAHVRVDVRTPVRAGGGDATLRVAVAFLLSMVLIGCGESVDTRKSSTASAFDQAAADQLNCSVIAEKLSLTTNSARHFESLARMQAGKFCNPRDVEFFACYLVRSRMSNNQNCPLPSPPPTESELQQCGNAIKSHLQLTQSVAVERIRGMKGTMEEIYRTLCTGTIKSAEELSTFK